MNRDELALMVSELSNDTRMALSVILTALTGVQIMSNDDLVDYLDRALQGDDRKLVEEYLVFFALSKSLNKSLPEVLMTSKDDLLKSIEEKMNEIKDK